VSIAGELQDLALAGWRFWIDAGRLRYRAPDTGDTESVLTALRTRRDEIVAALTADPNLTEIAPLSDGQRALWFLWRLAPESLAYNQSLPLRIADARHGDAHRWRAACERLVARHPMLRTRYGARDGEPWQQVTDRPIEWHERAADGAASFAAEVRAAHDRPFDLTAPPVRFTWITQADESPALLVTLHHIACDGWSLEIMRRELPALAAGDTLPPPAAASTYQDFVWWQRAMLAGETGERLWQFWQAVLDPLPAPLALPSDRERPAVMGYGGDARQRAVPRDVVTNVRALAAREGATAYAVFLAAFAAVLAQWTRQRELAIGTPNAGRSRPEFNGTVGYFVDPLVMRVDVDLDASFAALVRHARDTSVRALAHADFPFPRLVERLRVPRDAGRTPIFDVTFNFLSRRLADRALAGTAHAADVRAFDMPQADGKFDLTLTVVEDDDAMRLSVGYRTELFEPATIERFCDWVIEAVAAGAQDASTLAGRLLRSSAQNAQPRLGRRSDLSALTPLPEQIAACAADGPDRVAVVAADGTLTHAQLQTAAGEIAAGVVPHLSTTPVVATLTSRTSAFVRALAGAMHAGAAWMPLDPAYPDTLLASMLARAGASCLLADAAHADRARAFGVPVVNIDALPSVEPLAAPRPARLDDVAYVMFTSGSTGEPKGVAVSHRALANYTASIVGDLGLIRDDRLGMISSLAADLGHTSLFPALALGATLNLFPDTAASNPSAFASWMAAHPVDVLKIVPSHFLALADQPSGLGPLPRRVLVFGGESTPISLARRVSAAGCRVFNHYGPTETTIGVMTHAYADADEARSATLPLSRVIANVSVHLMSEDGAPVPDGMPGEVVIAGACVSEGYVNDAPKTRERFVTLATGERAYRTGDIARPLAQGGLLLLGRDDGQVGLHGYRIELGQIEHAARAVPGVARAIALADAPGERATAIGVWVVPQPNASLDTPRLLAALSERLPRHMLPSRAFVLDALPVTANGKVDAKALRAMLTAPASIDETISPARSARARDTVEWRLLALWREALKAPQLGPDDDFFAHGGHSLLAVRLAGRIADEFGVELPLHAFFTHRTVASLSAELRGGRGRLSALTRITRGGAATPLVCLPGAGGNILYFHDLADALGRERSVWGVDGTRLDAQSVEDTAAAAIAELDAAIAAGEIAAPLALAGHSFGALVAFEMARRLRAAGRPVSHLIVIDNPAPGVADDPGAASRDDRGWLRHIAIRIGKLYGVPLEFSDSDAAAADGDERLIARLTAAGALPPGIRAAQFRKYVELYKANARAAALYQPALAGDGQVDVPILLCRAETADPELQRPAAAVGGAADPTLGWSARTTMPVPVAVVPGTHITMLNAPNAHVLANAIRAFVEDRAGRASREAIS
jgi:amino acid adenylation domain-containing protein